MTQPKSTRSGTAATVRDDQALRKRSVTVAGHRTSVSLEEAFWAALHRIAQARRQSVSRLVTEIDRQRSGNLSSAIRVFVLAEMAAGPQPGAQPPSSSAP